MTELSAAVVPVHSISQIQNTEKEKTEGVLNVGMDMTVLHVIPGKKTSSICEDYAVKMMAILEGAGHLPKFKTYGTITFWFGKPTITVRLTPFSDTRPAISIQCNPEKELQAGSNKLLWLLSEMQKQGIPVEKELFLNRAEFFVDINTPFGTLYIIFGKTKSYGHYKGNTGHTLYACQKKDYGYKLYDKLAQEGHSPYGSAHWTRIEASKKLHIPVPEMLAALKNPFTNIRVFDESLMLASPMKDLVTVNGNKPDFVASYHALSEYEKVKFRKMAPECTPGFWQPEPLMQRLMDKIQDYTFWQWANVDPFGMEAA